MTATTLDAYIVRDPHVRNGRPRLAGTRITVSDLASWHLRNGTSIDAIVDNDRRLTRAQVHAALSYYFAHRAEIERDDLEDFVAAERSAEQLRAEGLTSDLRAKLVERGDSELLAEHDALAAQGAARRAERWEAARRAGLAP